MGDTASTFSKGLAVLDCFESGRNDMTMADIARMTGFDRATARRLCLTLENSGYLYKQGKFLRLAPKNLVVAEGYLNSENIGISVQPVLDHFAVELEGEIALAVRDRTRAIYIARSAVASARLSFGFSVGSTLPLLSTAVGRMLLASCPEAERDVAINDCELVRHTEKTTMDRLLCREKIDEAAAQSHAFVADEFEMGAAGVAVPIPMISNTQAVLATTASTHDLARKDQRDHVLDILRQAAGRFRVYGNPAGT